MKKLFAVLGLIALSSLVYAQHDEVPGMDEPWRISVVIRDVDISSGGTPVYYSFSRYPYINQSSALIAAQTFAKEGVCVPQEALDDPNATVWCYPASSIVRMVVRKGL